MRFEQIQDSYDEDANFRVRLKSAAHAQQRRSTRARAAHGGPKRGAHGANQRCWACLPCSVRLLQRQEEEVIATKAEQEDDLHAGGMRLDLVHQGLLYLPAPSRVYLLVVDDFVGRMWLIPASRAKLPQSSKARFTVCIRISRARRERGGLSFGRPSNTATAVSTQG